MSDLEDVECNNDRCGWKGRLGDCVCRKHDPTTQPLCPECYETVDFVVPIENASLG